MKKTNEKCCFTNQFVSTMCNNRRRSASNSTAFLDETTCLIGLKEGGHVDMSQPEAVVGGWNTHKFPRWWVYRAHVVDMFRNYHQKSYFKAVISAVLVCSVHLTRNWWFVPIEISHCILIFSRKDVEQSCLALALTFVYCQYALMQGLSAVCFLCFRVFSS